MIVTEQPGGEHYNIRPSDIAFEPLIGGVKCGAFGMNAIEQTAAHLISFFQEKKAWVSFTLGELKEFLDCHGWESACPLYGLTGDWEHWGEETPVTPCESQVFVVQASPNTYAITDLFIERCKGTA